MKITEAILKRHAVRKYKNKPLKNEVIQKLNNRIEENNQKYSLNMKLMTNNNKALHAIIKLLLAKCVTNYIILAGINKNNLDEKLGYSGADIMLYAQTLGLNTWWVGETFNKNVSDFVPDKKVIGIIAVGYGKTQGVQHKSKAFDDVATYEGEIPKWFKKGVEAALLAPTALNKQDFKISGKNNKISIKYNKSVFAQTNLGLLKYHFEIGAGKDNFNWE